MIRSLVFLLSFSALAALGSGCATSRSTNTARTGVEQLLISNAVDQAINKFDLTTLRGRRVFLEDKYLESVDKNYIIGSLRHRLLVSGAALAESRDKADVILEVRSGGVGTDSSDRYIGLPGIALPPPMMMELPEVRIWHSTSQYGTAKIAMVAYERDGGFLLDEGHLALARADDNKWYILGIGPFHSGDIRDELYSEAGYTELPHVVNEAVVASAQKATDLLPSLAPGELRRLPEEEPEDGPQHASYQ